MEPTKKPYIKPEMSVIDVKLQPILTGSGYPTNGPGYDGWFD